MLLLVSPFRSFSVRPHSHLFCCSMNGDATPCRGRRPAPAPPLLRPLLPRRPLLTVVVVPVVNPLSQVEEKTCGPERPDSSGRWCYRLLPPSSGPAGFGYDAGPLNRAPGFASRLRALPFDGVEGDQISPLPRAPTNRALMWQKAMPCPGPCSGVVGIHAALHRDNGHDPSSWSAVWGSTSPRFLYQEEVDSNKARGITSAKEGGGQIIGAPSFASASLFFYDRSWLIHLCPLLFSPSHLLSISLRQQWRPSRAPHIDHQSLHVGELLEAAAVDASNNGRNLHQFNLSILTCVFT